MTTLTQIVSEVQSDDKPDMAMLLYNAMKAQKRVMVAIGTEKGISAQILDANGPHYCSPEDYDPRVDGGKEYNLGA